MKVDVLNMEGKKVSELELPAAIFEAPINVDLMHQAYVRQMANARLGTHETKVRGEVWFPPPLKLKHGLQCRIICKKPVRTAYRQELLPAASNIHTSIVVVVILAPFAPDLRAVVRL